MNPARTITIPADYYGEHDAELNLYTDDGEVGTMSLAVDGCELARGEGFRAASFGPNLLELSDARLAGMFGAFLAHALESSEPDAQDGWSLLTEDAAAWTDTLALMEEGAES